MNSSSFLRPAAGYDKIDKRKARKRTAYPINELQTVFLQTADTIGSSGGYFLPLKIV